MYRYNKEIKEEKGEESQRFSFNGNSIETKFLPEFDKENKLFLSNFAANFSFNEYEQLK